MFTVLSCFYVWSSDCLEPGTRVISRWTNGNFYKGEIESLTNKINVLFDTGVRHSYNTLDYEDVLLDRIPEPADLGWGMQVVVNRPRSRAFENGYIREIKSGKYVVLYENGDTIYHTLDQIRPFNKSRACGKSSRALNNNGCDQRNEPTVFLPRGVHHQDKTEN